jgi:hypothetical protein
MPTKKKSTSRSKGVTKRSEADRLVQEYKLAFGILDSAVSAGLIAGLQPYSFEAPSAFWFIQSVGYARAQSTEDMAQWRKTMFATFDAIVLRVTQFASTYNGDMIDDQGELSEFESLKTPTGRKPLPELDLKRQQTLTARVVELCLDNMKTHNIDARVMELTFLIVWLKVAALAGDIPEQVYFIVRRTIPFVVNAYDDIAHAAFDFKK